MVEIVWSQSTHFQWHKAKVWTFYISLWTRTEHCI